MLDKTLLVSGESCSWGQCRFYFSFQDILIVTHTYTRPNILAFNLATSINLSLALLLIFMLICGGLLYYFQRSTSLCCQLGISEGLQEPLQLKSDWGLVIATFILTVLYLPLSTMAMHVLVWSEDLWIVPNPYINATTTPPIVAALGPENEFRDPLDFCWTTTMKRNEINFAPIVVIIAIICLAVVSCLLLSSVIS